MSPVHPPAPRWPVLLMAREIGAGGSERQLATIARSLDPALFEVHVGCFHGNDLRAAELRAAGIPILEIPVRSFASVSALAGACQFARFLRQRRIRLVHAFDVPTNVFAPSIVRFAARQSCVMLGSTRAHRDLVTPLYRRLLQYTDRMVDGIVVNCDFLRRHLIQDYGLSPDFIDLCPNGIDTAEFHAQGRERPLEFGDASLVIGSVGVLRPEKDFATLLEAFAQVRSRMPGIKLAIVGSGPCGESLLRRAHALGIAEDCIFVPARARVAPLLRGMDIFVLPSRSEGSSNALLEAMSCGCSAVASRVGGNPELLQDGASGLLFESGSAAGLAEALRRLIGDVGLRMRLAQAASRFTHQSFTLQASAQRMQQIYVKYLTRRGAAGMSY